MWQPSPYPERVTPNVAGFYLVVATVRWSASVDGVRQVRVLLNGLSNIAEASTYAMNTTHNSSATAIVYCDGVGDYLAAQAWHNASTSQELANSVAPSSSFSVMWLGA